MLSFFNPILGIVEVDPLLNKFVLLAAIIILTGITLKRLKQPYVVAYIITGIILGPHGFGAVTDEEMISYLGSLGLILLMFFIGMEISLPKLLSFWRIIVIGTLVQIFLSLLVVGIFGHWLGWPINRILMLAFVVCLSSTAVVIKLLQDKGETNSMVGRLVIGILLAQDISIVPMLIILSYVAGHEGGAGSLVLQLIGGVLFMALVFWLLKKKTIKFPFDQRIRSDHEIHVFLAFATCFGLATVSS
jgi:monovalent cation:H+ antiporter-2, CPA2 family